MNEKSPKRIEGFQLDFARDEKILNDKCRWIEIQDL